MDYKEKSDELVKEYTKSRKLLQHKIFLDLAIAFAFGVIIIFNLTILKNPNVYKLGYLVSGYYQQKLEN